MRPKFEFDWGGEDVPPYENLADKWWLRLVGPPDDLEAADAVLWSGCATIGGRAAAAARCPDGPAIGAAVALLRANGVAVDGSCPAALGPAPAALTPASLSGAVEFGSGGQRATLLFSHDGMAYFAAGAAAGGRQKASLAATALRAFGGPPLRNAGFGEVAGTTRWRIRFGEAGFAAEAGRPLCLRFAAWSGRSFPGGVFLGHLPEHGLAAGEILVASEECLRSGAPVPDAARALVELAARE